MTILRTGAWLLAGCIAIGGLLTTAGCSGCSNRGASQTDGPAEEVEVVRVLEPEEAPLNEVDAELREELRSHALVQQIFEEPPRLTHESEQETPRATITVYEAETLDHKVRFRVLWTLEEDGVNMTGIDVQYRDGASFQRQWNAGS